MAQNQEQPVVNIKKCRAIVVTTDGKRYLTRWFACPDFRDLEPDEPLPLMRATKAAERLAARKKLQVKQIDAMFFTPKSTEGEQP